MADNYIENLLENYPNFLLAIDRIIRLEPRRINQHKNPQQIISIRSISIRSISKKKKQNAITTKKKKNETHKALTTNPLKNLTLLEQRVTHRHLPPKHFPKNHISK